MVILPTEFAGVWRRVNVLYECKEIYVIKYQNNPKEQHVATKPFKLSCTRPQISAQSCVLKKKSLWLKMILSTYPHFCRKFQKCIFLYFSNMF
jgi:hypothetical protein